MLQQVCATKDKDRCRKTVGVGGSSHPAHPPSPRRLPGMDVCASQWRLDTWAKVDSASAAQVPQEHEICWRRCRRNTNADCIAVSTEPSSVDLATMGAQMAVRLEPPWIRHSAPTGCTKQEWNATASLPPLLLLQDAWNPFQMKRGKDSGVVWMGPAQSCLAQAALPGVRFRAPGAEMTAWPASWLPGLDPNKHQCVSRLLIGALYSRALPVVCH